MSFRPKNIALSATALAALMVFATGCSDSGNTQDKAATSTPAGSTSASRGDGQKAVDSGAAVAGIDPMNPPKPIASFTTRLPYEKDPKTTARFDIYSIKRQGKLATLTLSVTPTFNTVDAASLFRLLGSHMFRPTLVDPINLRKYEVVDTDTGSLSSDVTSAEAYSGEPMFLWATFAAPPPNVEKVNLNVHDTLPAIMDVPVQ